MFCYRIHGNICKILLRYSILPVKMFLVTGVGDNGMRLHLLKRFKSWGTLFDLIERGNDCCCCCWVQSGICSVCTILLWRQLQDTVEGRGGGEELGSKEVLVELKRKLNPNSFFNLDIVLAAALSKVQPFYLWDRVPLICRARRITTSREEGR